MSLKSEIEQEIKRAMLSKDKDRLRALRAIKSSILLAETDKRSDGGLSAEAEMKLLQKAAKQRRDSIAVFQKQNREDLAAVEQSELGVIAEFLPKQMSEKEIEDELKAIVSALGASGLGDLGEVMSRSSAKLAGKADGRVVARIAKKLLSH